MKNNRTKSSDFISIEICVKCGGELSHREKMYSSGVCPKCGHKGMNAVTIIDTQTIIFRTISFSNGFFKKPTICYDGSNEISIEWLQDNRPK